MTAGITKSSPPEVRLYFDAGCPWTWITSRWLAEVASLGDATLSWHPFSLWYKNRDDESIPDWLRAHQERSHRILRLLERVRQTQGERIVGIMYAIYGHLAFERGVQFDDAKSIQLLLRQCGLPIELAHACWNESLDSLIASAMSDATELVGPNVGSPIVVLSDPPAIGVWGPVLSPAPVGEAARQAFAGFVALMRAGGFFEMKRARTGGPVMPTTRLLDRSGAQSLGWPSPATLFDAPPHVDAADQPPHGAEPGGTRHPTETHDVRPS